MAGSWGLPFVGVQTVGLGRQGVERSALGWKQAFRDFWDPRWYSGDSGVHQQFLVNLAGDAWQELGDVVSMPSTARAF